MMNQWLTHENVLVHPDLGEVELVHVVPGFGGKHVLAPICRCQPDIEKVESKSWVVHHNIIH